MALIPTIKPDDWPGLNRTIRKLASLKLGSNAEPTFAGLTFTGLTASLLIQTNADKKLASVSDLTSWIAGTANQITVADDGDGTVTLSTPQDIHTRASPIFAGLKLEYDASNQATLAPNAAGNLNIIPSGGILNLGSSQLKCDELLLTSPTQDYLFTDYSSALCLQGQTSATNSALWLMNKDGDGTDIVDVVLWGMGTPAQTTNTERLFIRYNPETSFVIRSYASGTGTLQPVIIYTEGNTNQLYLDTDGQVGIGKVPTVALDVTGAITASGAITTASGQIITDGVASLQSGALTGLTNLSVSTTGELNFRDTDISIGSTLADGILDISADGEIRMFYDNADVGDAVDGQHFRVYRRAAEFDRYVEMYVDKAGIGCFNSQDDYCGFRAAGALKFMVSASLTTFYDNLWLRYDNTELRLGTGGDANILYNGTNLVLSAQRVGTGNIVLNTPKTTTGDPTAVEGLIYWNTVDNVIKMYADGAWRTLASW